MVELFGARYYDARTSVWQSPDPLITGSYLDGEPNGGVRNSMNLAVYNYSRLNPINRVDPDGLADIFIGGFWDDSTGIVKYFEKSYAKNHPNTLVKYFEWHDKQDILNYIENLPEGEPINIIGHSYGAHTGAQVAEKSKRKINLLITIDPVGQRKVNESFIENVKTWLNIKAKPKDEDRDFSDTIAGIGGKGGTLPTGKATMSYESKMNHGYFQSMMNEKGPSGKSASDVLRSNSVERIRDVDMAETSQ